MKAAKPLMSAVIIFLLVCGFPAHIYGCGLEYLLPKFDYKHAPENPFINFAAGNLGIVKPTYTRAVLIAAFRYLNGGGFNRSEQEDLVAVWNANFSNKPFEENTIEEAVADWVDQRKSVMGREAMLPDIYVKKQFSDFSFFPNCTKSAFEFASKTLKARSADYGSDNKWVRAWVDGQDDVFSSCSTGISVSSEIDPTAPEWFAKDRLYQIAANAFYTQKYEKAVRIFQDISQDIDSPWQELSAYLVGRSLIRQAEFTADAESQKDIYAEAETIFQIISAGGGEFALDAVKMIGLIKYRIRPKERVNELADQVAYYGGNNFRQDLIDYTWLLDDFEGEALRAEENRKEELELMRFSESDSVMKSQIEARMALIGVSPNVEVVKGVVTLSGRVPAEKYPETVMAANHFKPSKIINKLERFTATEDGSMIQYGPDSDGGFDEEASRQRWERERNGLEISISIRENAEPMGSLVPPPPPGVGVGRASSFHRFAFDSGKTASEIQQKIEGSIGRDLTEAEISEINTSTRMAFNRRISKGVSSEYQGYRGEEESTLQILPHFLRNSELTEWLFVFQMQDLDSYLFSLSKFEESNSDLWLVTALSKAVSNSVKVAILEEKAKQIGESSPAYPTIMFHLARLSSERGDSESARRILDSALDAAVIYPASTRNILVKMRMDLAESDVDFAKYMLRKPFAYGQYNSTVTIEEEIERYKSYYDPEYSGGTKNEHDERIDRIYGGLLKIEGQQMLDPVTTNLINRNFSRSGLRGLINSINTPTYLKHRFAEAIWTRSVILNDMKEADSVAPLVLAGLSQDYQLFENYMRSVSPKDRRFAAVFFILKHPTATPFVSSGFGPPSGEFTNATEWWCEVLTTEWDDTLDKFVPVRNSYLPFLKEIEQSEVNNELAGIEKAGVGTDFLSEMVFERVRTNPSDPRLPESLHILYEITEPTKYGCSSNYRIRNRAASILKQSFPRSSWTAKILDDK